MNFERRTCLVTGAAAGLGEAIATRFLKGGGTVLACDRDDAALKDFVARHSEDAARIHTFTCDVTDEQSVATLKRNVEEKFKVDVLVNNAGYYLRKEIHDITRAEWDRVFDVNVWGVFLMIRAFMDGMAERHYGRVVNIASNDAYVAKPYNAHYGASKAAVVSLTRSFAAKLVRSGVLVNGVSPGPISTDTARSQGWLEKRSAEIPVGRAARPEEMAQYVAFLASEDNTYMSGEMIIANGGV